MRGTITELESEIAKLRAENSALSERIEFLSQHAALARGMAGERLIAKVTGGRTTKHTAAFDVETNQGASIEVKAGTLSSPKHGSAGTRWQWNKIFGQTGNKKYDYLLLVGLADDRWRSQYRDPTSPYTLFLIPFELVDQLTVKMNPRGILLSTNPSRVGERSSRLFDEYQITIREIEDRFNFI